MYGTDDSGAVRMMNDGLFAKYPCDAIFAMHNMPGWPQGHLVFRQGAMMASSDKVFITLHGHGGHGALPHEAADPVVAAAGLVMALQTVVARNVDPRQTAVVTVGVLQAGRANNVIPDRAHLELSVRALDPEVRNLLQQRITAITHAQAQSFGVKAEIDYRRGYAVLVNDAEQTEFARRVGTELVGADNVTLQGPALTGSEDFAFCDHAFRIIGEDFCGDRAIHDGGDLFDGGVEVFAFLGDQRRIRGDAGNKSHIIGFADGFHISGIDKKFHVILLLRALVPR